MLKGGESLVDQNFPCFQVLEPVLQIANESSTFGQSSRLRRILLKNDLGRRLRSSRCFLIVRRQRFGRWFGILCLDVNDT